MSVLAFDALGTLFDLGDLKPRMAKPLHYATSLTLAGEWLPFDEIVKTVDPDLADALKEVDPYPDAREALGHGHPAWVLTNGGATQTQALLERAGLEELIVRVRSVEDVKVYKPHPDVYRMLPGGSRLISAHPWDVVGAQAAGYDAVWVNRGDEDWPFRAIEPRKVEPDLAGAAKLG